MPYTEAHRRATAKWRQNNKAKTQQYYEGNAEHLKEIQKKIYDNHKESINKRHLARYYHNKEFKRLCNIEV